MLRKSAILKILPLFLFFGFIGYFSYKRAIAFGCFDDCARYTAAYFMLKGRVLYSQIFDNHQVLTTYISAFIQLIFHPKTIYQLVLDHRIVLYLFGVLFDLLIIWRFRKIGVFFVLFYETTKFYLFGERFLSEAFIVYPLVYLFGLVIQHIQNKKISDKDILLSAAFSWFIVFSREPYIPLALFFFVVLLWGKVTPVKKKAVAFFLILTGIVLLSVPLKEYIYQVFQFNVTNSSELQSGLHWQSFFYPFILLFSGKETVFRYFLIGIDVVFLGVCFFAGYKKQWKLLAITFLSLGLANFRYVSPGTQFYEAFHLTQWYGIFLFSLFYFLFEFKKRSKKWGRVVLGLVVFMLMAFLLHKQSYVWDKSDRNVDYIAGYGNYAANGFVIKTLATPKNTLFADQIDDLLYVVADIKPAYKYSWYYAGMPDVKKFKDLYQEMFANYPPDFYLGFCPQSSGRALNLPKEQFANYDQLFFAGKPSCLYVKKTTVAQIPKAKWDYLKKYQYTISGQ